MSLHIVIPAAGHVPDIGDVIIKVLRLELLPGGGTGWVEHNAYLMDIDTEARTVRQIPTTAGGRGISEDPKGGDGKH